MRTLEELGEAQEGPIYVIPGQMPRLAPACYKVGVTALDSGHSLTLLTLTLTITLTLTSSALSLSHSQVV